MTTYTKTRRLVLLHALALTMLATGSVPLGSASAQAGDGYQRFIVECGFSHAAADDPIVVPMQPGATHVHDFLGNRRTDHRPGYLRMKRGDTMCATGADTSAYWVPALRHRSTGELVHATELRAYYYSTESMDDDPVVAFPRGYSAISDEAAWMCRNTERLAEPTGLHRPADAGRRCRLGHRLRPGVLERRERRSRCRCPVVAARHGLAARRVPRRQPPAAVALAPGAIRRGRRLESRDRVGSEPRASRGLLEHLAAGIPGRPRDAVPATRLDGLP